MSSFLLGATTFAYAVLALFFARFRARTGDRLFTIFAAAFAVLAVNRALLAMLSQTHEARNLLYVVRLVAFLLILYAIVDKNREARR